MTMAEVERAFDVLKLQLAKLSHCAQYSDDLDIAREAAQAAAPMAAGGRMVLDAFKARDGVYKNDGNVGFIEWAEEALLEAVAGGEPPPQARKKRRK